MPIFVFFVIFALWTMYEIRKSTNTQKKRSDAFWETEHQADSVRRQDISHLDYIEIPYATLPFDDAATEPVKTCQDHILALKDEKIVNLTGFTNTDLKLQYGPANLEDLMQFDANYTKLVCELGRWGKALYEMDNIEDTKTIFEYAVSIKSDVSSVYTILGQIYLTEDRTDAIYDLMDKASDLQTLMKDSIIKQLRDILSQDA